MSLLTKILKGLAPKEQEQVGGGAPPASSDAAAAEGEAEMRADSAIRRDVQRQQDGRVAEDLAQRKAMELGLLRWREYTIPALKHNSKAERVIEAGGMMEASKKESADKATAVQEANQNRTTQERSDKAATAAPAASSPALPGDFLHRLGAVADRAESLKGRFEQMRMERSSGALTPDESPAVAPAPKPQGIQK